MGTLIRMVLSAFEAHNFVEIAGQKVSIIGDEEVENLKNSFEDDINTKQIAQEIAQLRDSESNDNPFTILNLNVVHKKMALWKAKLPQVKPYYAVKCNNDIVLLRTLASLGVGFDCASRDEIDMVINNQLASPEEIIFANPCKTRSYIKHAENCGIKKMTFDSLEELAKIKQFHASSELILRIDVADETAQCPLATKFGCNPFDEAPKLLAAAKELSLEIVGISFHVGSGCNNPLAYRKAIFAASQLFSAGKSIGHKMRILDIGGGFPGHDTEKISFDRTCKIIQKALKDYFPNAWHLGLKEGQSQDKELEVVAEPGRYFASVAISLCANIIAKHRVPISRITKQETDDGHEHGFMYYINDGVYGSFNCILFDHFQPNGETLFRTSNDTKYLTTIWGPTCDSLDKVEDEANLPELDVGDWIYYPNMGAYTIVAASKFNGFRSPQNYYVIGDRSYHSIFTASGKNVSH